jgi:hypothetical protein
MTNETFIYHLYSYAEYAAFEKMDSLGYFSSFVAAENAFSSFFVKGLTSVLIELESKLDTFPQFGGNKFEQFKTKVLDLQKNPPTDFKSIQNSIREFLDCEILDHALLDVCWEIFTTDTEEFFGAIFVSDLGNGSEFCRKDFCIRKHTLDSKIK